MGDANNYTFRPSKRMEEMTLEELREWARLLISEGSGGRGAPTGNRIANTRSGVHGSVRFRSAGRLGELEWLLEGFGLSTLSLIAA